MSILDKDQSYFSEEYNKLDPDTQVKLDHFIAGIEEVGQDIVGGTIFEGSSELLNSIMPCLHAISSTITSVKINLENGTYYHDLKWEPNDFIIPPDVLVRAYERYTKMAALSGVGQIQNKVNGNEYKSDDYLLLSRASSAPSSYYECDDCPSSI